MAEQLRRSTRVRRPRQSLTNQLENFDITEDDDPLLRVPDNDGSDEDPEYKEETASEVDDDEIFHENQKVSGESEDDEISAVASVSDQGGDDASVPAAPGRSTAPMSAGEARMFRIINTDLRNDQPLFGELGADGQFVGLEETMRDWVRAMRYKSKHGLNLNERRLGLQAVVAQTLNNHVCDAGGYGAFKHAEGVPNEGQFPLAYAHREWAAKDREQYGSYAPRDKIYLDSVTSMWHWKR